MKKLILILLLVVGGFFFSSFSEALTLTYTLPRYNAKRVWSEAEQESVATCDPDSNRVLTDLAYTRIYYYPHSGGGWQFHRQKFVGGIPGQVDTLIVPDNANYFVKIADTIGNESCASNIVNGPIATGVPDDPVPILRVVTRQLYDVHGRKVSSNPRPGVYFERKIWSDGVITVKKIVIFR